VRQQSSPTAVLPTAARAERFVNSSARSTSQRGRPGQGPARGRSAAQTQRVDFDWINRAALARLPDILARWLPSGRIEGAEFVALNPRRADHRPGSFKVNLITGRWADFAVADARGRDLVSLAAYLGGIGQAEAAKRLVAMLGIGARDGR
jgi:hypothetical protein